MRKSIDFLLLGMTNITLVLIFMKSNKFYYVQTAKFLNSKMLVIKESHFVRWELFVHFSNSNFLVISPYNLNQRTNWQCFQQFWLHWVCFGFVSLVLILDICFSRKKLVLTNLNAIFQGKFAITSVIKIYSQMWELCVHPDYEHFLYSINFQIRQITRSNQHFS